MSDLLNRFLGCPKKPPISDTDATTPARAKALASRAADRKAELDANPELAAHLARRFPRRKLSGKTKRAVVLYGSYKIGTKRYHTGAEVEAPVEDVDEMSCLQAVK